MTRLCSVVYMGHLLSFCESRMLVHARQKVPLLLVSGRILKHHSHNSFGGRLHFTVLQFGCCTNSQL